MSMNKENLNEKLNSLMSMSEEDKLDVDKRVLSSRFLSEIQKHLDEEGILRKDFANKIGTSPSFITQLFSGNKVVSMEFLAKAQKELGINFYISTINNAVNMPDFKIIKLGNPVSFGPVFGDTSNMTKSPSFIFNPKASERYEEKALG